MTESLHVVSGGQTGVDRVALDVAIELGMKHGGWCPPGRLAEDGRIPAKYRVTELENGDYRMRTEKNVIDSDGTLVLFAGEWGAGTALTVRFAKLWDRPWLALDFGQSGLDRQELLEQTLEWIRQNEIRVLNVAGPRRSGNPHLPKMIKPFLKKLFRKWAAIVQA